MSLSSRHRLRECCCTAMSTIVFKTLLNLKFFSVVLQIQRNTSISSFMGKCIWLQETRLMYIAVYNLEIISSRIRIETFSNQCTRKTTQQIHLECENYLNFTCLPYLFIQRKYNKKTIIALPSSGFLKILFVF